MKRLPRYYRTSAVMWNITRGIDTELDNCGSAVEAFGDELNIATAEDNLTRWERDLQLTAPPRGEDYEAWLNLRRGNILAKLRGDGICFTSMLEAVAESYVNGRVSIDQSLYPEFLIKFCFIATRAKLAELIAAVNTIKPAHMLTSYDMTETLPPRGIYVGGMVAKRRVRRFGAIAAAKLKTYGDVSAQYGDYGELNARTYSETLLYD